jgi:hypothetical protein
MMLIGAMIAFRTATQTGQPWLGLFYAMLAAGALSLLHALVTINFQADQVVSGLAINFVGIGLSMVLGDGLSKAGATALLPIITVPGLSRIPVLGPIMFTNHNPMVYLGYLLVPAVWFYINRTRPGLHLRAVGEYPAAADALGINVYRLRYIYVGGMMAGLAGDTARLVQRADDGRTGLDCHRPGDLFAVEPLARRGRLLHVWRAAPADPRPAGAAETVVVRQPVLLHAQAGLLPADGPLCARDSDPGDWLTRGDEEASGRAGGAGLAVCAGRTRTIKSQHRGQAYQ